MTASYTNNGGIKYLFDAESEICAKFRRDGYLVLRSVVPTDLVDKIRYEIDETFISVSESARPNLSGIQPEIGRFQDAWRMCPSVGELAGLKNILMPLKELYGRDPHPFQTLDFSIPTQQPAHSDHLHFSSLPNGFMCGVWVALEDATPTNGPLFYFPGSHNLPYMNYHDLGIKKNKLHEDGAYAQYETLLEPLMMSLGLKKEYFHAQKGDAFIWSANLVHGGSTATESSPSRWSQVTHYYFDNCVHYTPRLSDELAGDLCLRDPADITTGQPLVSISRPIEGSSDQIQLFSERLETLENDKVILENALKKAEDEIVLATLVNKDYIIGLLAELSEYKYRDHATKDLRRELTDLLRDEMTKGYETGLLLVAEMGRANAAKTQVRQLQSEVSKIQHLRDELDALCRSRAFRLGRVLTSPIRLLRRIFS